MSGRGGGAAATLRNNRPCKPLPATPPIQRTNDDPSPAASPTSVFAQALPSVEPTQLSPREAQSPSSPKLSSPKPPPRPAGRPPPNPMLNSPASTRRVAIDPNSPSLAKISASLPSPPVAQTEGTGIENGKEEGANYPISPRAEIPPDTAQNTTPDQTRKGGSWIASSVINDVDSESHSFTEASGEEYASKSAATRIQMFRSKGQFSMPILPPHDGAEQKEGDPIQNRSMSPKQFIGEKRQVAHSGGSRIGVRVVPDDNSSSLQSGTSNLSPISSNHSSAPVSPVNSAPVLSSSAVSPNVSATATASASASISSGSSSSKSTSNPALNLNVESPTNKKRKGGFGYLKKLAILDQKGSTKNEEFVISRSDNEPFGAPPPAKPVPAVNEQNIVNTPPVTTEDARTRVAKELLETEEYFGKTLKVLWDSYKRPLVARCAQLNISEDTLHTLFNYVDPLYRTSEKLSSQLKSRIDNWDKDTTLIGDIFVDLQSDLRYFIQFGINYSQVTDILTKLLKNSSFTMAVEECSRSCELKPKLDSLLMGPIQRVPRYKLLLGELIKATAPTHPDSAHLQEAMGVLEELAAGVNDDINRLENERKFQLIASKAKHLAKDNRILINEAIFYDELSKEKYHLYLFNDILIHLKEAQAKDNKKNIGKTEYQWPLFLCSVREAHTSKDPNTFLFHLNGPGKNYVLRCASIVERTQWMDDCKKQIGAKLEMFDFGSIEFHNDDLESKINNESGVRYGEYSFPEGGYYSGWWANGRMHYQGNWVYLCNNYTGEFATGARSGAGVMKFSMGDQYQGNWMKDLPHGEGKFKFLRDDEYEGSFKDGKRDGYGTIKYGSGDRYDGDWRANLAEGEGTLRIPGGTVYDGQWKGGQRHGKGSMRIKGGFKYDGNWVRDVREGEGSMEYGPKATYTGEFKGNVRHGKGTFSSSAGIYSGMWAFDQEEGEGAYTYANGDSYVGSWKKGMKEGPGSMRWKCGPLKDFKGEWFQHRINGKGSITYRNGTIYEGGWKNGLYHGTGIITYPNGVKVETKYKNGAREIGAHVSITSPETNDTYTGSTTGNNGIVTGKGKPSIYIPSPPTNFIIDMI